jgi:voltage-gated sodium channel
MKHTPTQIGNWVESKPVRNFIIGLILINAITLGMETAPRLVQQYGQILHFLDQGILGVFVIEITLKGYAYGWRFFKSGWNIFDFLIIVIALMPSSGVFSVLRVLRILRILRLISLVPQTTAFYRRSLTQSDSRDWCHLRPLSTFLLHLCRHCHKNIWARVSRMVWHIRFLNVHPL